MSLANVGRSWAAGVLALWHCYLFATSGTLIFVNSCATILQSYIQWFSSVDVEKFQDFEFKKNNTTHFFGAFFRSYILLCVTSDVMRFTYLLCKDAFRADAFEAYRRLLTGDAWNEVAAGEFYSYSWSFCLHRRQKIWDMICQCLIHASIDVIPFFLFLNGIDEKLTTQVYYCRICLVIGMVHIVLFYLLWLFWEVFLKLRHFCRAWEMARGQLEEQRRTYHPTFRQVYPAECRSIYACCGLMVFWFLKALPLALGIATLIFGLLVDRNAFAVVAGLALSGVMTTLQLLGPDGPVICAAPICFDRYLYRWFPRPEILEEWAEHWCGLSFDKQKQRQYPFLFMLGFSALVFGFFRFPGLTVVCVALLAFTLIQLLMLRSVGHMQWLWCFLESIFETTMLIYFVMVSAKDAFADCMVAFQGMI